MSEWRKWGLPVAVVETLEQLTKERDELQAQLQEAREGIEKARYTLLCPVSGTEEQAVSILSALLKEVE